MLRSGIVTVPVQKTKYSFPISKTFTKPRPIVRSVSYTHLDVYKRQRGSLIIGVGVTDGGDAEFVPDRRQYIATSRWYIIISL